MKRSDLKDGGQYVGPGNQCYEIVDMSPGWCVGYSGEWVEDTSLRTRHMPGRGTVPYRSNLAIRVYIVEPDGTRRPSVIDPRKLSGPWEEFQEAFEEEKLQRAHAQDVVRSVRHSLRHAHHRPSPADEYSVRSDGQSVTLPVKDLKALAAIIDGSLAES